MSNAQHIETQQDTSNNPSSLDLVNLCLDRDAMKASDMLSDLLGPKLVDAIQTKKVEVAQSIYGTLDQQDIEAVESDEESVEDQTDDIEASDDTDVDLEDETEEENENA
jgi:predicted nucleic acid-binding protein